MTTLAAVSTKAYFGAGRTREWVAAVAGLAPAARAAGVEVAVLPSSPLVETVARALAGTGATWGAQDVAASSSGAQTGEVLAALLAELGCTYVEVGHAERRSAHGETDDVVAAKAAAAVGAGLVPLLCVGEPDRLGPDAAAAWCVAQVRSALAGCDPTSEVVVAYEPVWAIGADEPAPADHVVAVALALREALAERPGRSRLLYGGTAGPGTFRRLEGAVDGLFLGRRAHDPAALAAVVDELAVTAAQPQPTP